MIWVLLAALAVAAMAPLGVVLLRARAGRGRREAALALHRAQLGELDTDLAEGRIGAAEHAAAKLEVQRRLLAADEAEAVPTRGSRVPLVAAAVLVPLVAFGLYVIQGVPDLPSAPFEQRQAAARQEDALINQLRARLAMMDPKDDRTRQGFLLLGNAEAQRQHWADAADAYSKALALRFDPALAARAAEAITLGAGGVTDEARKLYQQALDTAPKDAPWRGMVEQRLAQAPP
jgi:cytochrome c-type biogenesis protein CcmH